MSVDLEMRDAMLEAARGACGRAYAPYSHFPVGAAVLDERGQIFSGCNVENISYGLTICAERNAVAAAIAGGAQAVRAVVIYTPTPTPTLPCGACRQVLAEFGTAGTAMEISAYAADGICAAFTLAELLPAPFMISAVESEES